MGSWSDNHVGVQVEMGIIRRGPSELFLSLRQSVGDLKSKRLVGIILLLIIKVYISCRYGLDLVFPTY